MYAYDIILYRFDTVDNLSSYPPLHPSSKGRKVRNGTGVKEYYPAVLIMNWLTRFKQI